MALIKCPECGKMFSEHAEICPECGCPKEIVKKEQKYICSECNTIIEGEEEACPNCGCPKDGFKVLEEPIAAYEKINITNEEHIASEVFSFVKLNFAIILAGLVLFGLIVFLLNQRPINSEYSHQSSAGSENEHRAEEKAKKKLEKQQRDLLYDLVGTWRSGNFNVNSEVGSACLVMEFSKSKQFSMTVTENITGRVLSADRGTYEITPNGDIFIGSNRYGGTIIEVDESMFAKNLIWGDWKLRKISR